MTQVPPWETWDWDVPDGTTAATLAMRSSAAPPISSPRSLRCRRGPSTTPDTFDRWSGHDLLAHCAAWAEVCARILTELDAGTLDLADYDGLPVGDAEDDGLNQRQVDDLGDVPTDVLLRRIELARDQVADALRRLDGDPPATLVLLTFGDHFDDHAAAFRRAAHVWTPRPVLVVDLGAQYAQLIARRVREANVYSEIVRHDLSAAELAAKRPAGIILSGGPLSVYETGSPQVDPGLFELGVPVLGICYGHQLMAHALGGEVAATGDREYGGDGAARRRAGRVAAGPAGRPTPSGCRTATPCPGSGRVPCHGDDRRDPGRGDGGPASGGCSPSSSTPRSRTPRTART